MCYVLCVFDSFDSFVSWLIKHVISKEINIYAKDCEYLVSNKCPQKMVEEPKCTSGNIQ